MPSVMRGLSTARLRRELTRLLPVRPFHLRFWDGSEVAATVAQAPAFEVRAPSAIAHVLRAPGRLGLGRAYVEGSLAADDLDAAFEVIDSWSAPRLAPASRARLLLAAGVAAAAA